MLTSNASNSLFFSILFKRFRLQSVKYFLNENKNALVNKAHSIDLTKSCKTTKNKLKGSIIKLLFNLKGKYFPT